MYTRDPQLRKECAIYYTNTIYCGIIILYYTLLYWAPSSTRATYYTIHAILYYNVIYVYSRGPQLREECVFYYTIRYDSLI